MKTFESFEIFWQFFTSQEASSRGFHDWQVVDYRHVDDQSYAEMKSSGNDELGFQPLTVLLANPIKKESQEYLIKNVQTEMVQRFLHYCRDQYAKELPSRFGSFTPDERHAFAEYDTWDNFYSNWLERDGEFVFAKNVPLLFDHTPKIDYWMKKQAGEEVLPYQRVLVTTFFVAKRQFYSFFIKEVDDSQFEQIKMLIQSRASLNIEKFLRYEVKHGD
jgi:hypothetical protein